MNILSQFKTPITDGAAHNTALHSHPFWQIDYYEGASRLFVELEGRKFTFRQKDQPLIVIPPYAGHKISVQGPYICYALKFESDFTVFEKINYCTVPLSFDEELIGRILDGTGYKDETETLILGNLLNILFLKLLKHKGISTDSNRIFSDVRLENAVRYINEALLEAPTTEMIARNACMSVTHFSRTFKKETGVTPKAYLRALIMKKAVNMLQYTDLTISQIADTLKFPDIHTFSRNFKKIKGVSPKNFRKKEADS